MAIGDSITAGAFSRGMLFSEVRAATPGHAQHPSGLQPWYLSDLSEWRGESYAIGMDPGAITLPNVRVPYLIRSMVMLKSGATQAGEAL